VPRRKISEFCSKKMIHQALDLEYLGWEVVGGVVPDVSTTEKFVLKVDQAVKQRFKRGLIYLDIKFADLPVKIKALTNKVYT
jgi:hypothetical protein